MNNTIVGLFLLIANFALVSCSSEKKDATASKNFTLSDTMYKYLKYAPTRISLLKNELNFYGKISMDNNKMVRLFPFVGGNVVKVNVELGDYVHNGDTLAVIRSTEIAELSKQLQDAKNDVVVAANKVKVAEELFNGKLNTEREVMEAKNEHQKSLTQLNLVMETYKIYNLNSKNLYPIISPIDGFVFDKKINQGTVIRKDNTDNAFDIAEINEVWAIANVNESEVGQIQLGKTAYVTTLSYKDKVFQGKVDKIFNVIDPNTKSMRIRIKLANVSYLLKPEMQASIRILYYENQRMIAVPSEAVIFDKSRNFVMVYKDRDNIETRLVEVFRQVRDSTYIKVGLEDNENVIIKNQMLIYNALND